MRDDIFDPSGASAHFTDDQIQAAFDNPNRKMFVRYELQVRAETIASGGARQFKDFFSVYGFWESDALIQNSTWNTITPDTTDFINGHWQFTSTQTLPLWVSGQRYNFYGVAADLCRKWAAALSNDYDFSNNSTKYARSQKMTMKLNMAKEFDARAEPTITSMNRSDVNRPPVITGQYN